MHIVIDLQGAQTASRARGIGRFSVAFTLALARLALPTHRITLFLNGSFPETVDEIRSDINALPIVPQVHIWNPLTPSDALVQEDQWRRSANELLYEAELRKLEPDFVIVTSLFEGHGSNAVTSIGKHFPSEASTIAIMYDLIPLIYPDEYLKNLEISKWYYGRIDHLRRANYLFAISDSSLDESVKYLGFESDKAANISVGYDGRFKPIELQEAEKNEILERHGICREFLLYTSAGDPRKNNDRLILAFAKTPSTVKDRYQLVIVSSSISDAERKRLRNLSVSRGLSEDAIVFAGSVNDQDLVGLCNLCALFVFPSRHEGFGLPVLEAMACGAPVLASNTSSLPEVVGMDEALFDPLDPADMANAITRAVTDQDFRARLKAHALEHAKLFSWEITASRAFTVLERMNAERLTQVKPKPYAHYIPVWRPRLAYVSPLKPVQSRVADYSKELLPVLSAHYDIEVIVDQKEPVTDSWVLSNARQRSAAWFERHAHEYDRIIYQLGDSPSHSYIVDLLEKYPGVVVLHDFSLSGLLRYRQCFSGKRDASWSRALLHAHGWDALIALANTGDDDRGLSELTRTYPCNLSVLQRALGVIVHSSEFCRLAEQWYEKHFADEWAVIPMLRSPALQNDRDKARQALRLTDKDTLVCVFGPMDETKLDHRLIEAWHESSLRHDTNSLLVFVGEEGSDDYRDEIRLLLRGSGGSIQVTGKTDKATYLSYLAAADIGVQLNVTPCAETTGVVLDCMSHGMPMITNLQGSGVDLPTNTVLTLPDSFTNDDLRNALERLWEDTELRRQLGAHAKEHIKDHHRPQDYSKLYSESIEAYYAKAFEGALGLARKLRHIGVPENRSDLEKVADYMATNYSFLKIHRRQLLVDISELHKHDARSGIQRVVRNVLRELLNNPPEGFRVEPVYLTPQHGYRYARRYAAHAMMELGEHELDDAPIFANTGDVFWGLDLNSDMLSHKQNELYALKSKGVRIIFTVYDLIPLLAPETCDAGIIRAHRSWIDVLSQFADGLLCISEAVCSSCKNWLDQFGVKQHKSIKLGWAHLGSEIVESTGADFLPTWEQSQCLSDIARFPAFLMVGTLEPRKNQAQVLAAFEMLWTRGVEVNLVLVGKKGWHVDDLSDQLRNHPMRDRHLFWLEGVDDALLEQLYSVCSCLIAASLDEGFGLPLIEAARHELPILARDIPVFREVAMEYASYFSGFAPGDLASAIKDWLDANTDGTVPQSKKMPWLTWAQATQDMLRAVVGDHWQDVWVSTADDNLVTRYAGSDSHLMTVVGKRDGTRLVSTGEDGYLLYGPYLELEPGRYRVIIYGGVGQFDVRGASVDISMKAGTKVLQAANINTEPCNVEGILADLSIELRESCEDLEVRINVTSQTDMWISQVEFRRADRATHDLVAPFLDDCGVDESRPLRTVVGFWATHPKVHTQVGHAVGRSLFSTARSGLLAYGFYCSLPAGAYRIAVYGQVDSWEGVIIHMLSQRGKRTHLVWENHEIDQVRSGVAAELNVFLDSYIEDFEISVTVAEESDIRLDGFVVSKSELFERSGNEHPRVQCEI